ncbi:MAG TPA: DMT family transporter [Candidatus Binatia bacterium]|nr:DMT family transporter [Candidatus Binatia bacterium]
MPAPALSRKSYPGRVRPGRFQSGAHPLWAVLLVLCASACFATLSAQVRMLSDLGMHPFVVTFWRNFFGLVFMVPWLVRHGLGSLRTGRFWMFTLRSGISFVSMVTGFWSLSLMPFAKAISMSFTAPLFATLLAALILKERVRVRRWSATVAGFIGVLIVLQPESAGIGLGEGLALFAAALSAVVSMIVKNLSRTESSNAIVTYMVLLLTPMSLAVALPVWTWPPAGNWLFMIGMGLCGTLGHLCWVRALGMAEVSLVVSYDYVRLLFAALIGYFAFSEAPGLHTWIGAAMIVGSGLYIARREAQLHQSAAARAVAASADPTVTPPARSTNAP